MSKFTALTTRVKTLSLALLLAASLVPASHSMPPAPAPKVGKEVVENLSSKFKDQANRKGLEGAVPRVKSRGSETSCVALKNQTKFCVGVNSADEVKATLDKLTEEESKNLLFYVDDNQKLQSIWAILTMDGTMAQFSAGQTAPVQVGLGQFFFASDLASNLGSPVEKVRATSVDAIRDLLAPAMGDNLKNLDLWAYPGVFFFVLNVEDKGKWQEVVIGMVMHNGKG